MTQLVIFEELEKPEITQKFISIYQAVHSTTKQDAENYMEVERFNFRKLIEENPKFQKCTPLSIISVFLEVISSGLTFDKSAGHVYIEPVNALIGKDDKGNKVYESRLCYEPSKDGKIFLCRNANSIKSVSDPIIVFKGDQIDVSNKDGKTKIIHSRKIPRESNMIIGGFCYITHVDNSIEEVWYDIEEVERSKRASEKRNKKWNNDTKSYEDGDANALYTSGGDGQIDIGFLRTKIINYALKYKPKKASLNYNTLSVPKTEQMEFQQAISTPAESAEYAEIEEIVIDGNGKLEF